MPWFSMQTEMLTYAIVGEVEMTVDYLSKVDRIVLESFLKKIFKMHT